MITIVATIIPIPIRMYWGLIFKPLGEEGVDSAGVIFGTTGTTTGGGADLTVAITSLNEVSNTDAGIFIFSWF